MATTKQREAAWKSTSSGQRSRAKPGTTGEGSYFRIIVRPKGQFTTFRNHDVGDPGGLQRIVGRRSSGSWATQAWLISKEDAHMDDDELVADSKSAKDLLKQLGSKPVHKKGDIFSAKDRRNVPEKEKPTAAQKKAQSENIKKAQAARRRQA